MQPVSLHSVRDPTLLFDFRRRVDGELGVTSQAILPQAFEVS